jgi:L-tryptophan--pyruvate aminotransferase
VNKIDMAWGSPAFLVPYWQKHKIKIDNIKRIKNYQYGSRRKLKRLIKETHKKIGNAETKNKHIVVAGGASQILLGLMCVLKELNPNTQYAWAEPPHFSRFPILADLAKLKWINDELAVTIASNPNNPDSRTSDEIGSSILDLCYNWPQYTNIKKYDHPIMVFSLSKATGHASTRIGWAVIRDKVIAKKLENYIEVSTGGLSIESQIMAERILAHQLTTTETIFEYGRNVLSERWKEIEKRKHKLPYVTLNNSGMFFWAKGKCQSNVLNINGKLLGATEDFFRLNIGCSQKNFNDFLKLTDGNV